MSDEEINDVLKKKEQEEETEKPNVDALNVEFSIEPNAEDKQDMLELNNCNIFLVFCSWRVKACIVYPECNAVIQNASERWNWSDDDRQRV